MAAEAKAPVKKAKKEEAKEVVKASAAKEAPTPTNDSSPVKAESKN